MSTTHSAAAADRSLPVAPSAARRAALLGGAAVTAVVLNAGVALLAHTAGVSGAFPPLQPAGFISLTVLGVLAGAAGWVLVRQASARPARVLRALVPVVVVVSWLPDVALLLSGIMPATTTGGVAALMAMHLVVTAVAVPVYIRALPLPRG